MNFLITGGTGFIGTHLVDLLLRNNYNVTVITDNQYKIKNNQITIISSLSHLQYKTHFDVIINLAGAPIDKRWTDKYKKILIDSRINSTNSLVNFVRQGQIKTELLINASAVGYYGHQKSGQVIDESTKANSSFTNLLCKKWEKAATEVEKYGVRVCLMRLGIVLGNGGIVNKLRSPFKFGLGVIFGDGKHIMPWIHIQDVLGIIYFLIVNQNQCGIFNLTSPDHVNNTQFMTAFAKKMQRNVWVRIPRCIVKLLYGEMGEELLLKGNAVQPRRILKAGYKFLYSDINDAFADILY